jgi:large subunit ribosomal protein L29
MVSDYGIVVVRIANFMTFKEFMTKSSSELMKDLKTVREEYATFRTKIRLGEAKNSHKVKVLRRDIARLLTALRIKQ